MDTQMSGDTELESRLNKVSGAHAALKQRTKAIENLSTDLRSLELDVRKRRLALAKIEQETHCFLAWLIAEHHHLHVPGHQEEAARNEWFAWFGHQSSYPPKLTAEWLTWLRTTQ
jgi:hypothetical protein